MIDLKPSSQLYAVSRKLQLAGSLLSRAGVVALQSLGRLDRLVITVTTQVGKSVQINVVDAQCVHFDGLLRVISIHPELQMRQAAAVLCIN